MVGYTSPVLRWCQTAHELTMYVFKLNRADQDSYLKINIYITE